MKSLASATFVRSSKELMNHRAALRHHQIHTTGKEREWRRQRNIDPLIIVELCGSKAATTTRPPVRTKCQPPARP